MGSAIDSQSDHRVCVRRANKFAQNPAEICPTRSFLSLPHTQATLCDRVMQGYFDRRRIQLAKNVKARILIGNEYTLILQENGKKRKIYYDFHTYRDFIGLSGHKILGLMG